MRIEIVLFFALVAISTQANPMLRAEPLLSKFNSEDALEVAQGILEGLQESSDQPGECYQDLAATVTQTQKVLADAKSIVAGDYSDWTVFAVDAASLLQKLEAFGPVCHLTGLVEKIMKLDTPIGIIELVKNLFENRNDLLKDAGGLKDCSNDYKTCGVNIGSVIRLLVGWKLQSPVVKSEYSMFIDGLMNGLSGGQNSVCSTDVEGLTYQVNLIALDIQKLLDGDFFVITVIYAKVMDVLKSLDGFAGVCNLPQLESTLESLSTVDGWIKVIGNYSGNKAVVGKSIEGLKNCSNNLVGCGTDLGTVISLVLGWKI